MLVGAHLSAARGSQNSWRSAVHPEPAQGDAPRGKVTGLWGSRREDLGAFQIPQDSMTVAWGRCQRGCSVAAGACPGTQTPGQTAVPTQPAVPLFPNSGSPYSRHLCVRTSPVPGGVVAPVAPGWVSLQGKAVHERMGFPLLMPQGRPGAQQRGSEVLVTPSVRTGLAVNDAAPEQRCCACDAVAGTSGRPCPRGGMRAFVGRECILARWPHDTVTVPGSWDI